jgi:hypothetical protein
MYVLKNQITDVGMEMSKYGRKLIIILRLIINVKVGGSRRLRMTATDIQLYVTV